MEENEVVMEGESGKNNSSTKKLIIGLAIIVVALLVIVGIINLVKPTPEKTVKQFLKNIESKKVSKVIDQMDIVGLGAFTACKDNYEDFNDTYEEYKEEYDDLDKDDVEEQIDSMKEELEDTFDDIDKIKIEIKKIKKAKKVKDAKNLYKVNAKIKIEIKEDDDTERNTTTIDFYVYKKSGKCYIVGMDTKSGDGLGLF